MGGFLTFDGGADEEAVCRAAEAAGWGAFGAAGEGGGADDAGGRLRVFDLHCDTLDRLALAGDLTAPGGFAQHDANVPRSRLSSLADNDAHVSLARTRAFSWCQCFAVFVPDEVAGDAAWALFQRVRRFWEAQLKEHATRVGQVRAMAEADAVLAEGRTAGLLSVEGLSFLQPGGAAEARLDALAEAGVRMATLVWNGRSAIGGGCIAGGGLTPFGRACVRELELRGIVVDASHLSDEGFKDLCDAAACPFIASHSNARAVCGHPRNLADWQLREVADHGGIVGLNFCRDFLSDAHADPTPDDVLRQVDHILETAGEDVLALGSDYDGCDVPSWLDPCDKVGDLHGLLVREFGRSVADKAFFGNARAFFERAAGAA